MKSKIFPLLLVLISACTLMKSGKTTKYTVAFYNVENLFDTIDDPAIMDEDFLPDGKNNWTQDRYNQKLLSLSRVIDSLGDKDGPEILGLCEIENKSVIQDLIETPRLKSKKYAVIHQNSPDKRGIDVGLIFKTNKFKVLQVSTKAINFPDEPDFKTRDILLVKGLLSKQDTIFCIVNHWPSRRGGEESEISRQFVALQVRSQVDSLLSINHDSKVLIMGDLNDEPDNASITEVLKAKQQISDSLKSELYNSMVELKRQDKGSYNYRNNWNMLDQLLLSNSLINKNKGMIYVPGSAAIYSPDWLKQQDGQYKGSPYRTFAGSKYLGGYSDHFPVYLHLSK